MPMVYLSGCKDLMHIYNLRSSTYDLFFPDRGDEIRFWVTVAKKYGRKIVDIMAGTGEISLGLVRKGFNVTMVDISPGMLSIANERLKNQGPGNRERADFVCFDVKELCLRPEFDFAFISTGSFEHLLTETEQHRGLEEILGILRPGGGLGLELTRPPSKKCKYPVTTYAPLREPPIGMKVEKTVQKSYNAETQILTIKEHVEITRGNRTQEFSYSFKLRKHTPEQILHLLRKTGFEDAASYGSYNPKPYSQDSELLLIISEKPIA